MRSTVRRSAPMRRLSTDARGPERIHWKFDFASIAGICAADASSRAFSTEDHGCLHTPTRSSDLLLDPYFPNKSKNAVALRSVWRYAQAGIAFRIMSACLLRWLSVGTVPQIYPGAESISARIRTNERSTRAPIFSSGLAALTGQRSSPSTGSTG